MADTGTNVPSMDELLQRINKDKKVARLMGEGEDGKRDVNLPAWFERRGIRTFAVDTGLGRVLCRVPRITLDGDVKEMSEEQMIPVIVKTLVTIPSEWKAEETFDLGGKTVKIEEGKALPPPTMIYTLSFEEQRDYLSCLPRSLATQVWLGLSFMALAPLPSDPQTST